MLKRFVIDRFLACHRKGIKFTPDKVGIYQESWDKSYKNTTKLLEKVMKMKPHETKETLSLNNAREYTLALAKPMAEAVELININLKKIKAEKEKCKAYDSDIESFRAQLNFKGFDLTLMKLKRPITVCAGKGCKTYVNVGEDRVRHTVYNRICHDPCYLSGVPYETTSNEKLRGCKAMKKDGFCSKCPHSYKAHMHITYKTTLVEKEFFSKETHKIILKKKGMKSQKEEFIRLLKEKIDELEKEKKYIYETACFFAIFLKNNAMIPYNDAFGEYIDMLIQDEEDKEKDNRDSKKIKQLVKEKQAYEETKKLLIETMASSSDGELGNSRIEESYNRKEKLCSLKHNGNMLKEALGMILLA